MELKGALQIHGPSNITMAFLPPLKGEETERGEGECVGPAGGSLQTWVRILRQVRVLTHALPGSHQDPGFPTFCHPRLPHFSFVCSYFLPFPHHSP